jgi:hypothetical protein
MACNADGMTGVMNDGINIPSRAELLHNNLINIQCEAGFPNTRGNITKVTEFHDCIILRSGGCITDLRRGIQNGESGLGQ